MSEILQKNQAQSKLQLILVAPKLNVIGRGAGVENANIPSYNII